MICPVCSKDFKPGKRGSKSGTCSRKCNAIFQNKKKATQFIPKKCKQCHKEIEIRQSRRVFCCVGCQRAFWRGSNHYRWKGGVSLHSEGYILLKMPKHPQADKRGWILQHRLIMEDIIGRQLKASEVVHHINGHKADNRPSNLQILENQSEHMRLDNPRNRNDIVRHS